MDADILTELKKCLERHEGIMGMPVAERAPFATGITKLELRIEQLRAATGMDTEQFVSRVREIMRLLYGELIPIAALDMAEFDRVAGGLDRAGACFRIGDQPDAVAALSDLERYAQETIRMPKQEMLPL